MEDNQSWSAGLAWKARTACVRSAGSNPVSSATWKIARVGALGLPAKQGSSKGVNRFESDIFRHDWGVLGANMVFEAISESSNLSPSSISLRSSIGRAVDSYSIGCGFDSRLRHHSIAGQTGTREGP